MQIQLKGEAEDTFRESQGFFWMFAGSYPGKTCVAHF